MARPAGVSVRESLIRIDVRGVLLNTQGAILADLPASLGVKSLHPARLQAFLCGMSVGMDKPKKLSPLQKIGIVVSTPILYTLCMTRRISLPTSELERNPVEVILFAALFTLIAAICMIFGD